MKILVVTGKRITGLNYHRQIVPFETLGIDCEYTDDFESLTDDFLKGFNCVSFLRSISLDGKTESICNRLKSLGIKIHLDIDDYWELPTFHPLFPDYKKNKVASQTVTALQMADFITTTNDYLAGKIKKLIGRDSYVLPNAINPNHEQWENIEVPNERMRFGYIAGTHHVKDVELLYPNIKKLNEDRTIFDKWQLCPAGFNLNKQGEKTYMNAYYKYVEQIFTHNYKYTKGKFKEYLLANNPTDNSKWNESYHRLWGMDTYNYGKLYNFIDVSLVPLTDNEFNRCKSNLKIIEAGFMKKACIVSDTQPYKECTAENAIIIKQTRNDIDWFTSMRKLINSPEMASDLGEAMYEYVKTRYHIDVVNEKRKQIFEHELK